MTKSINRLSDEQEILNNVEYWQDYALDLYRMGKLADSLKAMNQAEKLDPTNVLINHQIGFLHLKNNNHKSALVYANKAIEISNLLSGKPDKDLMAFKAQIYEGIDPDKAVEYYLEIIDKFENDPDTYDRAASLVVNRFQFSKDLNTLDSVNMEYNEATRLLRAGEVDASIESYKKVIENNKYCYPAYIGIAQALYESHFGSVILDTVPDINGIDSVFINYKSLNKYEKNITNASISLFARFIKELEKRKSTFIIAPIDVKLTDYPQNHYLKGQNYYMNVPFCHLRGIGGSYAFVGIERVRDFVWDVPAELPLITGCIAHEFAHQVWCVIGKKPQNEVKKLYHDSLESGMFISNYSKYNPEEYFAEYCTYFAKNIMLYNKVNMSDPMINLLKDTLKV